MLDPTLQYSTANGAPISDEALMEAITDHRPEALSEFYSRHGGRLKSVIGNVVHEEGDADDVLQDILLQIWREADHYSPKAGKLLGWVVTLARRRAIGRLRRLPSAPPQEILAGAGSRPAGGPSRWRSDVAAFGREMRAEVDRLSEAIGEAVADSLNRAPKHGRIR